MAWQDVIMLSVLDFVGSMIANIVNSLLIVKIDRGIFILFDEKPGLLWKVPVIAALVFTGETALVLWRKSGTVYYKIFIKEGKLCR